MPASSAWRISARVLPTPEKMTLGRSPPAASTRVEFAAGDDVKAAAGLRKHLQHAQGGVGLHGIADLRVAPGKAALVGGQRRQHGRFGIDEQGRAVLAGQFAQADLLDEQLVAR